MLHSDVMRSTQCWMYDSMYNVQCNMYVYVFGILLYNEQHHWVNMLQSNQTLTLQRSCNHHLLRTFHISIVSFCFSCFWLVFLYKSFVNPSSTTFLWYKVFNNTQRSLNWLQLSKTDGAKTWKDEKFDRFHWTHCIICSIIVKDHINILFGQFFFVS